ncbi:putative PIN family toxin of toxin-antitoxin system [Granulicella aggregans]|uniref:Putative PIN family toxin of toxin-antitoxin system n=1 Tax=Granulicella aggregans TaxID=474949 RepID=A0A7W7ZEJ7_9BACT|nr:putative toxin-antitoxin system toxin component, PIN family [Granulicella aggregans]MBB5058485.1 putative PIN family toxin of toxin-antitoxin system [Granulicella aggregans]
MIVVIDTNVWISGLHFRGGSPSRALDLASERDTIAISDDLEAEIFRILITKFHWPARRVRQALDVAMKRSIRCVLQHNVHVCRDPKDNMFLECATLARADVLVTGDNDLLSLGSYLETRILTPSEYLDLP